MKLEMDEFSSDKKKKTNYKTKNIIAFSKIPWHNSNII